MRVSSPWWLSAILLAGLVSIFMGERAFAHTGMSTQLSYFGCLLVAASVGLRGWVLIKTGDKQRRIERVFILSNLGTLLALVLYYLTTKSGMSMLGIQAEKTVERWHMVMQVLWVITLVVSLVPLLLTELSLGIERREGFKTQGGPDESVDVHRVREMASSGLSIALAASFLMVTCNIANERNLRKDVSYFKTSSPGTATVNIAKTLTEPLRVLLFFPEDSEVVPEVELYLDGLDSETHNVDVEVRDRVLDADLAKEHGVRKDGTVLLLRGEKSESFSIDPDIKKARRRDLREFDSKFQTALLSVVRDTRKAYFTVNHGELNDPQSVGAFGVAAQARRATAIKTLFKDLNYKTEDFKGMGQPIPEDCDVLVVLAPRNPLLDEEYAAIDSYLAGGGAALLVLDPDAALSLEPLQERLGLRFNKAPLADDKEHLRRTGSPGERILILTNQFLSHASVASLGRRSANSAMLFPKSGSFDEVEGAKQERKAVVSSLKSSWRETTPNYRFDSDSEKRDKYGIVYVVEDKNAKPEGADKKKAPKDDAKDKDAKDAKDDTPEHPGMRVALIADAEVVGDGILGTVGIASDMVKDLVRWTGNESEHAGTTESESDKRIEHTKGQDAAWFYATVVGAPLFVLGIGLFFVRRRRGRKAKK